MVDSAASWREQAQVVTALCRRHLPGLVGVYVHGSAALGGMSSVSGLDVLVITKSDEGASALGASLLLTAGEPRELELSVVTSTAAQNPQPPWPFVLHVNSADHRSVLCHADGDPDLVAHYAVTREAGIVLNGPEPKDIIGTTDSDQLLQYLCSELQWGLDHGDQRYAVLNACRACAFASTGRLLSKIDGATWWIQTRGPSKIVTRAHESQTTGMDLGPSTPDARTFVADRIAELRACR